MHSSKSRRHGQNPETNGDGSGSSSSMSSFMDLPIEAQKEIIKHVPRKSLTTVQLVSKHFHELASAELYSKLGFFFTHADSPAPYEFPSHRLADALHTFAAGDHDYGQYLREFCVSMWENDSEEVQRRVASKYHVEEEALQFLNSMLLLMLRKATALEKFTWDAPIELRGRTYEALSKITSLHYLFIRLDTATIPRIASYPYQSSPAISNNPGNPPMLNPPGSAPYFPAYPSSSGSMLQIPRQPKGSLHAQQSQRRRFAGFRDLREFQVIGIDTMESIDQIASCMRECSISLKSVAFSLSPHLTRKARRPPPGSQPPGTLIDPIDEDDDDITQPNTPTMPATTQAPQINEADIRKEQKVQESILARIFGLMTPVVRDKKLDRSLKHAAANARSRDRPEEVFITELKNAVNRMIKAKASGTTSSQKQGFFESLSQACDKYLTAGIDKRKQSSKSKTPNSVNKSQHYMPPANPNDFFLPSNSSSSNAVKLNQKMADIFGTEQPTLQELENFMAANSSYGMPSTSSKNPSSAQFNFTPQGLPPPPPGLSSLPPYATSYSTHPPQTSSPLYSATQNLAPPSHPAYSKKSKSKNYLDPTYVYTSSKSIPKPPEPSSNHIDMTLDEYLHDGKSQSAEASKKQQDDMSDSDESSSTKSSEAEAEAGSGPVIVGDSVIFPAGKSQSKDPEDEIDIDMEHPDVVDSDSVGDQETPEDLSIPASQQENPAGVEDITASTPPISSSEALQQGYQPGSAFNASGTAGESSGSASGPSLAVDAAKEPSVLSPEETMREYIRMKHGFSLEKILLYLVPLKPSVLAKALNLSALRTLTLLSVGPQGAFWTLMEKHHSTYEPIHLKHIHTDDVSLAFLSCISVLSGIESLFMVRRNHKEFDSTTTKAPASLSDIRLYALRKHIGALKCLSIWNNEDDSWDLDSKCLKLITAKGTNLRELALSVDASDFHTLVQRLPGLRNLIAIHLIAIRPADRMLSLPRECRKFLLDVVHYHPSLKLRYVASAGSVYEIGKIDKRKSGKKVIKVEAEPKPAADPKGKGKAKVPVQSLETEEAAEDDSESSEGLSDIESSPQEVVFVKRWKFSEVPQVIIFKKLVRTAKL